MPGQGGDFEARGGVGAGGAQRLHAAPGCWAQKILTTVQTTGSLLFFDCLEICSISSLHTDHNLKACCWSNHINAAGHILVKGMTQLVRTLTAAALGCQTRACLHTSRLCCTVLDISRSSSIPCGSMRKSHWSAFYITRPPLMPMSISSSSSSNRQPSCYM